MNVSYGIHVVDENDEFVAVAERAVRAESDALVPGRFLVEFLPFLRHYPVWLPGGGSQRLFEKWRKENEDLKNLPFAYVTENMVS